jgi:hypothetical protein
MCRWLLLSGLLVWCAWPNPARADWYQEEAQISCDAGTRTLEIRPYGMSSNGNEPLDRGFTAIEQTQIVRCLLHDTEVQAKIVIFGASMGQCEGDGLARLTSLSVGGVELLSKAIDIDDEMQSCLHVGEPDSSYDHFDSIKLHVVGSSAEFFLCTYRPDSDGHRQVACKKEHFEKQR